MTNDTHITLTPATIEQHMRHSRQLRSEAFLRAVQGLPRMLHRGARMVAAFFA